MVKTIPFLRQLSVAEDLGLLGSPELPRVWDFGLPRVWDFWLPRVWYCWEALSYRGSGILGYRGSGILGYRWSGISELPTTWDYSKPIIFGP